MKAWKIIKIWGNPFALALKNEKDIMFMNCYLALAH